MSTSNTATNETNQINDGWLAEKEVRLRMGWPVWRSLDAIIRTNKIIPQPGAEEAIAEIKQIRVNYELYTD